MLINFVGDVMLGRLIDQSFAVHVHEPDEARIVESMRLRDPGLGEYDEASPWGSALPLLKAADLNIINLETSVTSSSKKWPDKVFNYRMHPKNIKALLAANVSYASLANNHTLDFAEEGLVDTVNTLKRAGIAFAGAGLTAAEAVRPAILPLSKGKDVLVWSASDHPSDWGRVPNFHLIDYGRETRQRLKGLIQGSSLGGKAGSLRVFSVHWGPNYSWRPADEIQSLAHFLIDECGIDIIHGHSSHHVQGVEKYHGKLIIYGCGDFVDDYALVAEYRNDLSAVWRVGTVEEGDAVKLDKLEIFPTKIVQFQSQRLSTDDHDHEVVCRRISELSAEFGPHMRADLGDQGQLVMDL